MNMDSSHPIRFTDETSASIIIERNAQPRNIKRPAGSAQTIESLVAPKKKRRKATRNEIDDIFDF